MKIVKVLETRIDINNISDTFCSNYDKRMLQILNDKYLNKCFKSIYIISINKIIRRSALHCKNKSLDGTQYVDISFEVDGIVYEKGDIIHNCKIIQINDNGTLHAKSEHVAIFVKNTGGIVVFKESDEISVIVNMTRYNLYETEISISAIPFVPIVKKSIIYKISDDALSLSEKDQLDIAKLSDMATILEKRVADYIKTKKANKDIYEFFKKLLYPYKIFKKVNYGTSVNITTNNLIKLDNGDMIYKPEGYIDDNTYLILTKLDKEKVKSLDDATLLEISKMDYITYLYNTYITNLTQLLGFLDNYDSKEKIKLSGVSWALYETSKK